MQTVKFIYSRIAMKRFLLILLAVWVAVGGASEAQSPPLLKARLKIEGIHKRSSVREVRQALLSVPGVKKVDFKIPRRWFFFKDYKNGYAVVEFEHGTVTSETLIQAVERISRPQKIYKVKFLE